MKPIVGIFEAGTNEERYQPDLEYTDGNKEKYNLNQRQLAALVGVVAIALPVFMWFGAQSNENTCFYQSLSHFYYAQFLGGVFIACLVFIATFLVVYRGDNPRVGKLSTLAGISALGVALFPTSKRGCDEAGEFFGRALVKFSLKDGESAAKILHDGNGDKSFFQLFENSGTIHLVCAGVLFAFLAYYSFRVFTRVVVGKQTNPDGSLTKRKKLRNKIYVTSGVVICVSMGMIIIQTILEKQFDIEFKWWNANHMTFWLEGISLWAFGFSWLLKGRFFELVLKDEEDLSRNMTP